MDKFVQSEIRITPVPRKPGIGYTVRSKYQWPPQSPSTDSTTSLAQLHDRLNAFTPLIYNKVPQKISATPDLPTVEEVNENDDLSNTSKRCRVGVATRSKSIIKANPSLAKKLTPCQNASENKISLGSKRVLRYQSDTEFKSPLVEKPPRAYHSDSEAKTVVKRPRLISPVNEENSPNVRSLLVATLGTSDESFDDAYDRLCKDNPQNDFLDLLMLEALQHDQEKDSGVSSKITQASDVVENTPIEKNAQRKKLNINRSKQTVQSNSATDESNTDVIDDTPCYVYDRKKRVQTNTKKSSNVITEEVNAYDAAAVDTFFSQHMNENNGSKYISPTLAKKINETSSEASDDDVANITVLHEEYLNDMSYFEEVVDVQIIECLNSMIDKVCSDIDKCTDLVDEKHQQKDVLSNVQHLDEGSSDVSKTKDSVSLVDDFEKTSDTKKITLKFNFSKKQLQKMNKKQQIAKKYKQPIKVQEDNVIIEDAEVKSPERTTKTILTRKKRKLYSPKDGDNDNNKITRTILNDESRQSIVNKTPIATCYKELEKARKSRIRLPRKSRAGSETITSPKTKNLNDLFDKIKENVENEETVILVDKPISGNKNVLALYNLSSESEDQDFKEKNIKVQKRVSSSSLKSSGKKRSRVVKPKQFSDKEFCDLYSSGDESNMIKKDKIVKQKKPRSRKVKREQNFNLNDERMRMAPPEALETSFIKETVNEEIAEVEPTIQEAPVLEIIPDDVNDLFTEDIVPENKSSKNRHVFKVISSENVISQKNEKAENEPRTPRTLDIVKIKKEKAISQKHDKAEDKGQTPNISDIVKIKKEKATNKKYEKALKSLVPKRGKVPNKREIIDKISKGQDSATVSPLPGLVVEAEQLHTDDMTSSIEAILLQKLKSIYTAVPDLSDTQNLILNENNYNDADRNAGFPEQTQTPEVSDTTERSIATVGRSPITAHNDLNEVPPNVELLHEEYQHRDVNLEEISRDMAEFLDTMRSQVNSSRPVTVPVFSSPVLPSRTPSKRSIMKQNTTSAESITTDPVVVLKRLSTEEVESILNSAKTPSRTSQISSSKVLSRKSSAEIEKYQSPHTMSCSTRSPQVLLDRLSSKDIEKWLPISKFTCEDAINDKTPKKNETTKILIGVTKTSTGKVKGKKLELINSPASDKIHEKKLKSTISNTADKSQENKVKSMISPVKLDFCFENTNRGLKRYNTRSSIKSTQSNATKFDKNKDEEFVHVSKKSSDTATTEKYVKENVQQKTQRSVPSVDTTDILKIEKTKRLTVEPNSSDKSENTAMVEEWVLKNVTASTSGKADNAAVKDILSQVSEVLETTLAEIDQTHREQLMNYFLENQKQLNAFKEDCLRRLDEMGKMLMEGAYRVLREDAEKKSRLVRLLQEDIQAAMDIIDKTYKDK